LKKVVLTDLGGNLSVDSHKFAKALNRRQKYKSFFFEAAALISPLGDPDLAGTWYYFKSLFKKIRESLNSSNYDFAVGITHVRATEPEEAKKKKDKDYFPLSDISNWKISVITEAMASYKPESKTLEQYIAYLLMCNLLTCQGQYDPTHEEPRYCLFDDCEDRYTIRRGIEKGTICSYCKENLSRHNVDQQMLSDVKKILNWCRKNSTSYDLINIGEKPLSALMLGSGITGVSAFFIANHSQYVLCLSLVAISVPLLWFILRRLLT
jgi:hypothetical protein